jgi:hypothetical protein
MILTVNFWPLYSIFLVKLMLMENLWYLELHYQFHMHRLFQCKYYID